MPRRQAGKSRLPPLVTKLSYAPVSKIPTIRSGPFLRWGAGRTPGCSRLNIRFRVAQVVQRATGSAAPYTSLTTFQCAGGGITSILPLTFCNTFYYPTFITNLTRLFSFYYLNNVKLTYEPRTGTQADKGFVLSFVEDIEWFESHGLLVTGQAVPDEASLVTRTGSCTSNTWDSCEVKAVVDKKRKFFTAGSSLTSNLDFSTENPATLRQTVGGSFAVSGTFNLTAIPILLGDVYMDLDIELCDFSLNLNTIVTLNKTLDCKNCEKRKLEDVEDLGFRALSPSPSTSGSRKSSSKGKAQTRILYQE